MTPADPLRTHLDGIARTAGRIRSLARAAELVQTGGGLVDQLQTETIVIDLLDVIADLSGRVESLSETL